jgi:WD40 repeat protein
VSAVAAPPASPFKGLAAFADSELDALFFFGRERERDVLVANLLASRLTVLYGESGVGKSSLLAAAVLRDLRLAAPDAPAALHGTWSGTVDHVLSDVAGADEGYLILDQFEEYFLYHAEEDGPGALLYDLPELLHATRVNALIAIREDSLARLDAFKARIPAVFANQIRLEHLDVDQARSAILGPLERWTELTGERVAIEPGLVDDVLDQTRTLERDRIEAPYLQLVLEKIWNAEREAGSTLLRRETLRGLGGAAAIVRDHLLVALGSLGSDEQDVAADMFEHLVTPSGTKIAHRAPDLAEYARVPEGTLRRVLAALTRDRIVHSVDGSDRYEIFHDVLAEPISAWRLQRRLEQERDAARKRQRRLVAVVVVACAALAIVGALAVWALSERGTARSQARHAFARELDAQSLQVLQADPNRGLKLALAAARLESRPVETSVLRQALVADRLRLSAHLPGAVHAVAVSPRGSLIAVAAGRKTILFLSGRNRRRLGVVHTQGFVSELAFSRDGTQLVAGQPAGGASVFDTRTRAVVRRGGAAARLPDGSFVVLPLHGALRHVLPHIRRLVVTVDGTRLAAAVAGRGGRVQVFLYKRNGDLIRALPGIGIRDLTFSPDGALLAVAVANSDTTIWDARTARGIRNLREGKSGANVLAFSPDGALLATGGRDDAVRVWTVATGERTFFLFQHKNPIDALAWSPDGRIVASGGEDDTVVLWRVQNQVGVGSLAAILSGSTAPINSLAFTRDSTRLVTGGGDATLRVWDARPDQQLAPVAHAPGSAVAARWAGKTIVALWSSGTVETFDAQTLRPVHVLQRRTATAQTALGVSRDGAVVAAGSQNGRITAWAARRGVRLWSERGTVPVHAVAVSPAGDLVAGGDTAGRVHVWRAAGGHVSWSGTIAGPVAAVAFSPDGTELLAAGKGGVVVWSAAGRLLHTLRMPATALAASFSPDGRLVAAAGADGKLRLWFATSGHRYRVLPAGKKPLTGLAFSADSTRVAASSRDSDARVWSVPRGLGHVLQRSVAGPLAAISLDASGDWAVGAGPSSAIIWNTTDGLQLFYLRGHGPVLTSASFAPLRPTVLTASTDGTVRVYTCEVCVNLPGLVHLTEERLARTR